MMMSTTATTMRMPIATILMSANQNSSSPKSFTVSRLRTSRRSKVAAVRMKAHIRSWVQ